MERNTWPGEAKVQGLRRATGIGPLPVAPQFKFRGQNPMPRLSRGRLIVPFTEAPLGENELPAVRGKGVEGVEKSGSFDRQPALAVSLHKA